MQEEVSKSPARKAKGKFPDVERALVNWARGRQRLGMPITDSLIKEKLRYFASTVAPSENHFKLNNTTWLEKFKQKNGLTGSKSRKGSIAEESEATSNPESGSHTPNLSPTSPGTGKDRSPSAMSIVNDDKGVESASPDHFHEYAPGHKAFHSMGSAFTDAGPPSFSPGATSPTSPFFGDHNPFAPPGHSHGGEGFQRPRSQTFPVLGLSYGSPSSSEALTPKYTSSTTLESPAELISAGPSERGLPSLPSPGEGSRIDPLSPSLGLPVQSSSPATSASSIGVQPSSPTLEDTRRALEVVMNFFQHQPNGVVEPQEYMVMGKLMEKLNIQPIRSREMPGGMYRIGESFPGRND
jgi:Tc5 transposase DNA-binding domain